MPHALRLAARHTSCDVTAGSALHRKEFKSVPPQQETAAEGRIPDVRCGLQRVFFAIRHADPLPIFRHWDPFSGMVPARGSVFRLRDPGSKPKTVSRNNSADMTEKQEKLSRKYFKKVLALSGIL